MKQNKLILDYSKFSDADLNLKSKTVVVNMTGNMSFPDTKPTIAEFTTLQNAYNEALEKTNSKDRQLIAVKNQNKLALVAAMRQLAMNVDAIANGDKVLLLSSGFDLAANNENPATLGVPTDFKIMDGVNSGELRFSCKKAANAVSYNFEYVDEEPTDQTQWIIVPSTSREITVRGLRSGMRVYGRIKAIGRKGQQANSEVLSRLVQ